MATIKKYKIDAPNDPEIPDKVRDFLEYYMVFPTGYSENKKYGIVFCISGYGETVDSEYYMNKLCTYISEKYNIISVGVRYHNDKRVSDCSINIPYICNFYNISEDYFNNTGNTEGVNITDRLFDLMIERKVPSLDPRVALNSEAYHKYSSFGFMPAIDHLVVLHNIFENFDIDRSNIIAFGTSYGGYIASLMAKYAPQTFSLVIDNSGFCLSQLQEVLGSKMGGVSASIPRIINGKRYEIPINTKSLWSTDETSEYYFSDAHKQIRNLLIKEHRVKSKTMYCCYHSVYDRLAPISLKDKMYDILSKYNLTYYKRVEDKDIDGELFKNTDHGMNASLRKLFDLSIEKFTKSKCKTNNVTDFDLGLTYSFICADKRYNFDYSDKGLNVTIDKIATASSLPEVEDITDITGIAFSDKSENYMSDNKEIINSIIDLLPTLKEGLEYIKLNCHDGNLISGINVAEDCIYCIKSIQKSINDSFTSLPENKIDYYADQFGETINILIEEYKKTDRENIIKTLNYKVLPSFIKFEREITRIFQPNSTWREN